MSPASTVASFKRQVAGALLHNVSAMPQRTGAEALFWSQAYKAPVWCRKSGACVDELKLVAQKLRRLPVVDPALPVVSCNPAVCLLLFTSLSACAPVCLSICLSVCLFVCLAVCWPVCQAESICWKGFCAWAKSGVLLSDCAAINMLVFIIDMTADLPVAARSNIAICKLLPLPPQLSPPHPPPLPRQKSLPSVCAYVCPDMCLPVCVHERLSVHSHRGRKPCHAGCSGGSSQCWQVITGECAVQRGSRGV